MSISRLLPRALRRASTAGSESKALGRLPRAMLDVAALRRDVPDVAAASAEWPDVERAIHLTGMEDPAGGVNRGDRRLIYQLARVLQPATVLEVGTHVGASTLMLALALAKTGGKLTTVDVLDVNAPDAAWKRTGCRQNPRESLQLAGVGQVVTFHRSDSVKFLAQCTDRFDLIFLDGLHEAQMLYRELPLALKLLKPGGLILLHDVFPELAPLWSDGGVIPGPWLALARYRDEAAPIRLHPLGALPWPTKQGSNVTSLAYVLGA